MSFNQATQCPIWNRAMLRYAEPGLLCAFGADNNCGLFFDNETNECQLLSKTLRVKQQKEREEQNGC